MGGLAEAILEKALRALESADLALAESVRTDDLAIDQVDVDIDSAVLHLLALQAPVAEDLRRVTASKTIAIYLERVGDLSRNLAGCAGRPDEAPWDRRGPGVPMELSSSYPPPPHPQPTPPPRARPCGPGPAAPPRT